MGGYPTGADYVVAWPNAEVGFMAPQSAVPVLFKRELEAAEAEGNDRVAELSHELAASVRGSYEPWTPASRTSLHDIIRPEETRQAILDGLFIGASEIPPPRD